MTSAVNNFLNFCQLRGISVQRTPNAFHFKIEVDGKIMNCWPSTDRFSVNGEPTKIGLLSYMVKKFDAAPGSYLNNYITQDPDTKEFKYLLENGTYSIGYKFKEDSLFEFGKYCAELGFAAVASAPLYPEGDWEEPYTPYPAEEQFMATAHVETKRLHALAKEVLANDNKE